MHHYYIFWSLITLTTVYAAWRGGSPERWIAGIFMVGSIVYRLAQFADPVAVRYRGPEYLLFAIDVATLVATLLVAFKANRRWPQVVAAFQLTATIAHPVKMMSPDMIRFVYVTMTTFLTYPILIAIVIGVYQHQRRLKRFGSDPAWRSDLPPPPIEHR